LAFVNGYVNMKSGWYSSVPLFWINCIFGILAYYGMAVWIDRQNGIFKI